MINVVKGTAHGKYCALKQAFADLYIPMDNLVRYFSVTEYPNVTTVKYLILLVSSYAVLKLPKRLNDLCRDIFNHFHCSCKRQELYH